MHWQAIERIKAEVSTESEGKQVKLEFMHLDLASLSSAKAFTVAFQAKNLPLHILVNNAGLAWVPLGKCIEHSSMSVLMYAFVLVSRDARCMFAIQ